jgi:hypothetical protein
MNLWMKWMEVLGSPSHDSDGIRSGSGDFPDGSVFTHSFIRKLLKTPVAGWSALIGQHHMVPARKIDLT